MNNQIYLLILRLLHIGFGIFWAGSVLTFALFVIPSAKAAGPEGAKFIQQLGKKGYPVAVMISAIISIVAGVLLMAKLSNGFQHEWFMNTYARVIGIGAGLALVAFFIGFFVNRPAAARINKISQEIASQGTPPTNDQMAQLTSLRKKLFKGTNYIAVLLSVAVIAMSIFRYV